MVINMINMMIKMMYLKYSIGPKQLFCEKTKFYTGIFIIFSPDRKYERPEISPRINILMKANRVIKD